MKQSFGLYGRLGIHTGQPRWLAPMTVQADKRKITVNGHLCRSLRNRTLPARAKVMALAMIIGQLSSTTP